jgi:hypothetical protein
MVPAELRVLATTVPCQDVEAHITTQGAVLAREEAAIANSARPASTSGQLDLGAHSCEALIERNVILPGIATGGLYS